MNTKHWKPRIVWFSFFVLALGSVGMAHHFVMMHGTVGGRRTASARPVQQVAHMARSAAETSGIANTQPNVAHLERVARQNWVKSNPGMGTSGLYYYYHTMAKTLDTLGDDKFIDDCYEQIFRELLTYMMEDTKYISRALKVIFIAKHLERVGDHSSNIAEMVIFLVRGQDIRHGTRVDRG